MEERADDKLSRSAAQTRATDAADSTPRIQVVLQDGRVTRALAPGRYLVGHTDLCGLRILDPSVEARHAQLVITNEVRIVDLCWSGTYVNGERIRGFRLLFSGDRLRVGSYEFTIWLRPLQRTAREATGERATVLPAFKGGPAPALSRGRLAQ